MSLQKRKPTRLKGFDYSSENYYFVTICTDKRKHIFSSKVGNGLDRSEIQLNALGKIAEHELLNISNHFDGVKIDKYVIMPNHIHAIIVIGCDDCSAERSRPFPTVSTIIGLYKSGVSRQIHKIISDITIWQTSFYDEVIKNDEHYNEICQYINENAFKWTDDKYYCS